MKFNTGRRRNLAIMGGSALVVGLTFSPAMALFSSGRLGQGDSVTEPTAAEVTAVTVAEVQADAGDGSFGEMSGRWEELRSCLAEQGIEFESFNHHDGSWTMPDQAKMEKMQAAFEACGQGWSDQGGFGGWTGTGWGHGGSHGESSTAP